MVWPMIVTAIVAVYSAVLSTYILISRNKEKKRQLKVELSFGFMTEGPELSQEMLFITVSNTGFRPVTLNASGILLPNKHQLIFMVPKSNVQFPYELLEGRNCTVWIEVKVLVQDLKRNSYSGKVKLKGFFRDATGAVYKSKRITININEWDKKA